MQRRDFLKHSSSASAAALAASGAAAVTAAAASAEASPPAEGQTAAAAPFHLAYAPHFGMFSQLAGNDPIDQLKFAADHGFRAWEDNGMKGKSPELQEKIGRTLEQLGMQMGVFVAHGSIGRVTFSRRDNDVWEAVLQDLRDSIEVAKRVNATWMTVVPGNVDERGGGRLDLGYQTANVIELLRRCCDVVEPHGLVMVLEPLNWFANHGGVFLQGSPQAYALCKAVNRPSCKILFDIYHQQITEGNLIPNIRNCWDEIGYFQCGDNPGRKEPGTGEINYRNVFREIHARGFKGVMGMEHGVSQPGADGERALIAAYRDADNFT